MSMNIKKLTDEELAALTFAMERYCDNIREENPKKTFAATTSELGGALSVEYNRRKLNWKQFQK